jgi:hypothetical protein
MHVLWLLALFLSQVRGVFQNSTVYERMISNVEGKHFPYDEGTNSNCKQFFGLEGYRVDWTTTYTLQDMYV